MAAKSAKGNIIKRLHGITLGKKRLSFKKPIEVTILFRDGLWIMQNSDLDIFSMSTNRNDCLKDFNEEVFFVYEAYGQGEDDKLTNGAKELKRKILQHIGDKLGDKNQQP